MLWKRHWTGHIILRRLKPILSSLNHFSCQLKVSVFPEEIDTRGTCITWQKSSAEGVHFGSVPGVPRGIYYRFPPRLTLLFLSRRDVSTKRGCNLYASTSSAFVAFFSFEKIAHSSPVVLMEKGVMLMAFWCKTFFSIILKIRLNFSFETTSKITTKTVEARLSANPNRVNLTSQRIHRNIHQSNSPGFKFQFSSLGPTLTKIQNFLLQPTCEHHRPAVRSKSKTSTALEKQTIRITRAFLSVKTELSTAMCVWGGCVFDDKDDNEDKKNNGNDGRFDSFGPISLQSNGPKAWSGHTERGSCHGATVRFAKCMEETWHRNLGLVQLELKKHVHTYRMEGAESCGRQRRGVCGAGRSWRCSRRRPRCRPARCPRWIRHPSYCPSPRAGAPVSTCAATGASGLYNFNNSQWDLSATGSCPSCFSVLQRAPSQSQRKPTDLSSDGSGWKFCQMFQFGNFERFGLICKLNMKFA